MPFIPHTPGDINVMLAEIGEEKIEALFDELPAGLLDANIDRIPVGVNEMQIARIMQENASRQHKVSNFIGAGAYEHYIPAAVWQIAERGEFYTAYTPYQAEASQGSLQLIYEYQSMMAALMHMDVSNASMYDGASSLVESVLMAVRIKKGLKNKIILPKNINPAYQRVLKTMLPKQMIEIIEIDFNSQGVLEVESIDEKFFSEAVSIIIPQPNFFGLFEAQDNLTNWAHKNNLLVIAVVNPLAMARLKPPGQWGHRGADIVCGEGQPLGVPLSYGGPYFGFMCCKKEFIRNLPGRLVGKTKSVQGKEGYVLTLQAREQHIRRGKATSNICTNQGLLVVAATIYLSLLGAHGLSEVATVCHHNALYLAAKLKNIPGVSLKFQTPFWHEFVISLPKPVSEVQTLMRNQGIECGFDLTTDYPALYNALLVCTTETKTEADLDHYARVMQMAIVKLLSG